MNRLVGDNILQRRNISDDILNFNKLDNDNVRLDGGVTKPSALHLL